MTEWNRGQSLTAKSRSLR